MTTQDKIKEIREACIKANPEIAKRNDRDLGNGLVGTCLCIPNFSLADVLLAIKKFNIKWNEIEMCPSGMFSGSYYDWEYEPIFWNLKDNNLDHQKKETIDFIHDLLKTT